MTNQTNEPIERPKHAWVNLVLTTHHGWTYWPEEQTYSKTDERGDYSWETAMLYHPETGELVDCSIYNPYSDEWDTMSDDELDESLPAKLDEVINSYNKPDTDDLTDQGNKSYTIGKDTLIVEGADEVPPSIDYGHVDDAVQEFLDAHIDALYNALIPELLQAMTNLNAALAADDPAATLQAVKDLAYLVENLGHLVSNTEDTPHMEDSLNEWTSDLASAKFELESDEAPLDLTALLEVVNQVQAWIETELDEEELKEMTDELQSD